MFLLLLYKLLTYLVYPFYRFRVLPKRVRAGKEDPARFQEKLGYTQAGRPDKPVIWFHAASVGESLSLLKLVQHYCAKNPKWQVLLTTGTRTSAQIVQDRFPKQVIHQYAPLDFQPCVDRFIAHWQPQKMVWVESELWPNLITSGHRAGVPMTLLNMRLSENSLKTWLRFKSTFVTLLKKFDRVLTQTNELCEALKKVGLAHVSFDGNLKYAADAPEVDHSLFTQLEKAFSETKPWLVASTHQGEEEIVLKAQATLKKQESKARLILVPRHPERCAEVEILIKQLGLSTKRYSHWLEDPKDLQEDVLLVDQMGVMGLFYEACSCALVGGSLVNHIGGHNILEPLRQKCVPLFGPYMGNFKEVVADVKQANAGLEVSFESAQIADVVLGLLTKPKAVADYVKNGQAFIHSQNAVLEKVLAVLETDQAIETSAKAGGESARA